MTDKTEFQCDAPHARGIISDIEACGRGWSAARIIMPTPAQVLRGTRAQMNRIYHPRMIFDANAMLGCDNSELRENGRGHMNCLAMSTRRDPGCPEANQRHDERAVRKPPVFGGYWNRNKREDQTDWRRSSQRTPRSNHEPWARCLLLDNGFLRNDKKLGRRHEG